MEKNITTHHTKSMKTKTNTKREIKRTENKTKKVIKPIKEKSNK